MFLTSFDYRKGLIKPLIEHTKNAIGLDLIESNSSGPRPVGPFATYTITSPYIAVIFEDNLTNSPFECVVSLTIHDKNSSLDALNLAERYRKSFITEENLIKFKDKNITIITANRANRRDNLLSIDYERLAGFDLRVRLVDSFTDDTGIAIANIEI